ncbi:hypothetical protein [Clostridium algidicarnis]|uniref:hypothetical protein n=1 Tax=Clostridium algidicarnis TaxID=37659 RepID=UPI001C0C70ED|nr:hypothetical protein [Clostridium algidicarnis]MBU3194039.1 hypothetical protein [Clostridium algidicarnis]
MFKYLKYELKGSYKLPIGLLVIMALWCPILYSRIGKWDIQIISTLTFLTCFAALLVAFIYIIHLYKQDFSDERGYLTFTLPLNGKSILCGKLLLSFIWLIVASIASISFISIIYIKGLNTTFGQISITLPLLIPFIYMVVGLLTTILTIFISITLSKVAFRNKRIGGISFVIFILLNTAIGFLNLQLVKLFPQSIELPGGRIVSIVSSSMNGSNNLGGFYSYINIVTAIFYLVVIVGLFTFNSYLIDKKLDL